LLAAWGEAQNIDDESAAHCLQTRASIAMNASQPHEALHYATLALARARLTAATA
jgi:hypothetical protein